MFPVLSENDLVKHWDGWRRHDCEYIYAEGDLDSKRQCKRCKNLDKNMRAERFPELFPDERGGVSPETDCDDDDRNTIDSRTISEAVIENEEAFRGRILDLIVCYEKDLSKDYVATKIEFALYLSNYAGEGGLSFITEPFFEVLQNVMRVVSTAVLLQDFASSNSGIVWAKGKNLVFTSSDLLSDFTLACKRQIDIAREADSTFPDVSAAVIAKVFKGIVTKICNARFGAVEDAFKLRAHLKGGAYLSFRGLLAASVKGGKKSDSDTDKKESLSPITLPVPGEKTAVGEDFLQGKKFVLYGFFLELGEIAFVAKGQLRACLESFGATVGKNLTTSTGKCKENAVSDERETKDSKDYLVAGKDTPTQKIKTAQDKSIRIVNLDRVLRLLRGQLEGFTAMHALQPLDKTSFTDKNYEPAVDEAAEAAEDADVESDEDDEFLAVELDADKARATHEAQRDAATTTTSTGADSGASGAKPTTYADAVKTGTPPPKPKRSGRRGALAPLPANAQAGNRRTADAEAKTPTTKKKRRGGRKKRGAASSPATSNSPESNNNSNNNGKKKKQQRKTKKNKNNKNNKN